MRNSWVRGFRAALLCAALVGSVLGTAAGAAAAVVPGSGALIADPALSDGAPCADVDGNLVCSLRAAVAAANDAPGSTVTVLSGTHLLTSGELDISANGTSIIGAAAAPGPSASTIQSDGSKRVFDVNADDVVIAGVVITGGNAGNASGGGIRIGRGSSLSVSDSTIAANSARDGAGIDNRGGLVIERSTIVGNVATRKGGGLRSTGTTTADNVTIIGNVADKGGGVSSPGSTEITHATIVENVAGSSSSGGVDRNGGSLTIRHSIIANNLRSGGSTNRDCSGTPELVGLNLVSVLQGCNPIGGVIEAQPQLGALAVNGGATQTLALVEGSPALDAIAPADCSLSEDQRGTSRPTGSGCDLGAFEEAPLAATYALDVDVSNYAAVQDAAVAGAEVEVGVVSIPTGSILSELTTRAEDDSSAGIAEAALRSVALRSVTIDDLALRSVAPEAAALRSVALRSVDMYDLALRSVALRSVIVDAPLRSVALRSVLLSDVALRSVGGWETFIANTPELAYLIGVPLQSITLEDIVGEIGEAAAESVLGELTLDDVSLDSSALRSVALRSVLLAGVPLRSVPVPDDDGVLHDAGTPAHEATWCSLLGSLCGTEPGQIASADLMNLDLLSVQLAGGDVDGVPIFDIPLSTALRSVPLRSVPLRSVLIQNSALRSVPLRSVALRSVDTGVDYIGAIVDCAAAAEYCDIDAVNEFTLGDVPDAALIGTVESIAGLPADLIDGLSFGDLLLAFMPPDDPSWETLDIERALLQNISNPLQPTFDYVATVEITGGPADLEFSLVLPAGFAAARAPSDALATFDGADIAAESADLGNLAFHIADVGTGTHTLRVPVRAGLETGSVGADGEPKFPAFGSVVATGGGDVVSPPMQSVAVNVVPADGVEDGLASTLLTFDDSLLSLAHVSSEGDVDLYRLEVPQILDGVEARVRLSNIPVGADYDLAFYRPTQPSLRNEPTAELSELGDFGFDLDPTDDVYPTDVAGDVALDVPEDRGLGDFTVGDSSTRRSNEDEEIVTGVLVGGEVYYVAVTPYLQSFSAQPYGLRLRVGEGVDLPECVAAATLPAGTPAPPSIPAVPSGVDTLYVTNSQWLHAEVGDTTAIFEAVGATAGVNGVVPMLVPVDAYPGIVELYDDWKSNRCDPAARNDVVTGIGNVLDDIVDAAGGSVENIVVVGADGVVPMAAVADLTKYSNESTFASSVLFPGPGGDLLSNEVSAALGNGYLLTDDPYAADAGISVNEGDHELFVPVRNLGRLVETGPEILGQLLHFAEFDGQLDPSAVPGPAAPLETLVTGYDFLDDGAGQIANALDDVSTITRLDDSPPLWDRAAFLDALDDEDYRLLSPNAHYDWESLLPAAPDDAGFFDSGDLVTTANLLPGLIPTNALIFTMGCHAGLSVDDVQIGFNAPDWAQTYAFDAPAAGIDPTTNLYAAHTTYGYGDTEIVAYSERLLELFAEELAALIDPASLDAPASVGAALVAAKQDYLATTMVLTPYDEKILQSLTFYGLPMYDIGDGSDVVAPAALSLEAAPAASPVSFGPTDANGVTPVDIDLTVTTGDSGPTNLNLVESAAGAFFEVDGHTVSAQYRVAQPLVTAEIPEAVPTASGLLITELTSVDFTDFDPLYVNPLLDSSAEEGRVEVADGSFPSSLQRIAPGIGDRGQQLNVAAGQYEDVALGGVQRVYPHIGGELHPLTGSATEDAPLFRRVVGRVGETEATVQFDVTTDATADRVYVLFLEGTPAGETAWRGVEMALVGSAAGSRSWLGASPVSEANADVQFFVQALNDNGVSISTNKVDKFLADKNVDGEDLEILLTSPEPSDPTNGYYTADVTATVTYPIDPSGVPRVIEISVDSGPFESHAGDQVTVSGDGGHVVLARDDQGGREYFFFVIDGSAPELTASVFPDVAVANSPVTVSLSAADVGQSGVAQIVYTVNGVETVVNGRAASIVVADDGETDITAYVDDVAGNRSALWSRTITIDQTAPTVTVDPVSADYVNYDVVVTVRATDDSGVSVISIDGVDTGFDPAISPAAAAATVSAEGTTTVTFSATDVGGNTSTPATVDVKIDKTAPTVPVFAIATEDTNDNGVLGDHGDAAVATFRCDDATSGIAVDGCTISVDGGAPLVPIETDEAGNWTVELPGGATGAHSATVAATDVAGNSFTTPAESFTTAYAVCLDYDPTQAKNVGSNYTIRIRLCDADGNNLSDRQIKLVAVSIDGTREPEPNDSGNANSLYKFRFQSDRYVYNLNTTNLDDLTLNEIHTLDFSVTEQDGTVSYGVAPFTLQ